MDNQQKPSRVVRLCLDAMFVALYVIFAVFLAFKVKSIEISWSSLPILLCILLISPADGIAVAVCGSFLEQVLSPYGMTATTPLWMAPVILQAVLFSVGVAVWRKNGSKNLLLILSIVLSELFLTGMNIGASYLDAVIFDYLAYLSIDIPIRLLNGTVRAVLSAVIIPLLLPPLDRALHKRG